MKKKTTIYLITCMLASCASIKPYEVQYINDPSMQMSTSTDKNFRNYVHSIREGALSADSHKSSGGCGCN